MGAWISTIFVILAFEGIFRSIPYLIDLKGGSGPPILALIGLTIFANTLGGALFCLHRGNATVPAAARSLEYTALQTVAEECFRFAVFGTVFGLLVGLNALLGCSTSIAFDMHPWIDRMGWPGMWAALIANVAFAALHVKNGQTNTFVPFLAGALFTCALLNYGVLAATALHLVYNLEGIVWIALQARRQHT